MNKRFSMDEVEVDFIQPLQLRGESARLKPERWKAQDFQGASLF